MLTFDEARAAVNTELRKLYEGSREQPRTFTYGWDTGTGWAPMVNWDGVMGVFIYLVNKRTGVLTALDLPAFEAVRDPKRVGTWPPLGPTAVESQP